MARASEGGDHAEYRWRRRERFVASRHPGSRACVRPGREAGDRDTVFQTSEARTRTELRATTEHSVDEVLHPKHQAKDTLQ